MAIKLGLGLPQMKQYDIGRDVATVATAAEGIGYESLWVFEVIMFPTPMTQGFHNVPGLPWPDYFRSAADPLVVLALAAAATERARIGTGMLIAPLHLPFQLARSLASLDVASRGRLVMGIGTGWSTDQTAAAPVAPFNKRGAVLDELLDVCAAVWGPDPVSYSGQFLTVAPCEVGPKPVGPMPIYLPALSPRSKRRLVDRADGWMPVAGGAARLAGEYDAIRQLAAERGRERPLDLIVRVTTGYTPKPIEGKDRQLFHGSVAQIVEDMVAHAEALPAIAEFVVELQIGTRDAKELVDVAAETFTALREAGI
jgi:probable F420-dependent oxidoreductase